MAQTINNMSVTWNESGTTFDGIKLAVTDTASNAASNLLNFTVGGNSRFKVDKTGSIISSSGAITASDPALDVSQTWNASDVTFTGLKANFTDTASASGSLLMDLQVGGGSRFSVGKNSTVYLGNGGSIASDATNVLSINNGIAGGLRLNTNLISLLSTTEISWSSTTTVWQTPDVRLFRDAANTLAQRNGVNPQTFRLYNSYTDASNYERAKIQWDTNVLKIGTEKAGTGTARALEFQTDGTTRLIIEAVNTVVPGVDGANLGSAAKRWGIFGYTANITNIQFSSNGSFSANSDGIFRLLDNAGTSFNRLQFGGTTSSFPALKRSTTSLQARLADDSAFTNIQGKLTTDTAYTAGAPTADGYLVIYDSNGTAYKIPAVAV